jgi:hypothetical protein
MKKEAKTQGDELLPEYDFTGRAGIRGRHHEQYRRGYSVRVENSDGTATVRNFRPEDGAVVLDPDVRAFFPDSDAVNRALRGLIQLIPQPPAQPARA